MVPVNNNRISMIVNRKVIQDEMLRHTLQEEVDRLNSLCTNRHFHHLQEKIRALENQISYNAYNYNQRLTSLRSMKEHSARIYTEAINEKKARDGSQRQLVEGNRQMLSNLHKTRRLVGDQRKKNNDESNKSQELAQEEASLDGRARDINSKAEEQQGWIKRLQAAEQLCKREQSVQREAIEQIRAEIKLENIGYSSMQQGTEEVKRQIDHARMVKQQNYVRIQQQKLLFEQQHKECLKQSTSLEQERELRLQSVGGLESKQGVQAQEMMHLNREVQQSEKESSDLQGKVVKNMKLIQEVNNQLFETRLHRTTSKIKTQQLSQKIERLKRIKAELFNLIC